MEPNLYLDKIEKIYKIILERENEQREINSQKGYFQYVFAYEDIDLDDIFRTELIEIFPYILEYYNKGFAQKVSVKTYKVFLAVLCETAKNGFTQGGILKTIEEYI